jgi:hypothetical protein
MNLFSKNIAKASIVISLLATTLPPAVAAPKQIWSCQAESATRKYVVDQLDRDGTEFDLAIFSKDKSDDRDYLGTIVITAAKTNPEYIGKGVTDSSNVDVNAFGRTVAFNVNDSKAGTAAGRCSVNWQMADSRTRRSVRQCLANASKASGGNIPEVTRFACTTDPEKGVASSPPSAGVEKMIPADWKVEQQTAGDLNGDRQPDMALRLIQSKTGQRALMVLLAKPSGWEKLALAPKLLLCQNCGGMLGTPSGANIKVMIEDGVLVVDQLMGSRDAIRTIHRFWIDRPSQKLVCIGEDINPFDRANGNKVSDSRNFLTGKRIIETSLVNTRDGHKPRQGTQELQVSKVLQPIESIDIEVARQNAPVIPID